MATAIANRMRQIRDRSHHATRARSATRVTSRIYTLATVLYLDDHTFTPTRTSPTSTTIPRCCRQQISAPRGPGAPSGPQRGNLPEGNNRASPCPREVFRSQTSGDRHPHNHALN